MDLYDLNLLELDEEDLDRFFASEAEKSSPIYRTDAAALTSSNHDLESFAAPNFNRPLAILARSPVATQYEITPLFDSVPQWRIPNDASRPSVDSTQQPMWDSRTNRDAQSTSLSCQTTPEVSKTTLEGIETQQNPRPPATLRPAPLHLPTYKESHWSTEDRDAFMRLLAIHGTDWELIAQGMPSRPKPRKKGTMLNHYVRCVEHKGDENMKAVAKEADQRIAQEKARGTFVEQEKSAGEKTRVPRYSNWTEALRTEFLELLAVHGRNWAKIAEDMRPMRGKPQTLTTISNYYYHCVTHGDKKVKQIADDAEARVNDEIEGEGETDDAGQVATEEMEEQAAHTGQEYTHEGEADTTAQTPAIPYFQPVLDTEEQREIFREKYRFPWE